jgi:hypothetical protein
MSAVVRPNSDDSATILATVLTVVGVILAVICLERLWSSCRRTIQRRQGREGFSALQQPDGGDNGAANAELEQGFPGPDDSHHDEHGLQLTNVRLHDDDHL